jgi:hypothetical protein
MRGNWNIRRYTYYTTIFHLQYVLCHEYSWSTAHMLLNNPDGYTHNPL